MLVEVGFNILCVSCPVLYHSEETKCLDNICLYQEKQILNIAKIKIKSVFIEFVNDQ